MAKAQNKIKAFIIKLQKYKNWYIFLLRMMKWHLWDSTEWLRFNGWWNKESVELPTNESVPLRKQPTLWALTLVFSAKEKKKNHICPNHKIKTTVTDGQKKTLIATVLFDFHARSIAWIVKEIKAEECTAQCVSYANNPTVNSYKGWGKAFQSQPKTPGSGVGSTHSTAYFNVSLNHVFISKHHVSSALNTF